MAGFIRKRGLTYAIYMHVAAKIQLQHFIPFSKQIGVKMKMKVSMNLREVRSSIFLLLITYFTAFCHAFHVYTRKH